jgi:hypothetical protein
MIQKQYFQCVWRTPYVSYNFILKMVKFIPWHNGNCLVTTHPRNNKDMFDEWQTPSSYRALNTFLLDHKNQSAYVVSGPSCCLFSDKYKTHQYSYIVGRMYNCWMLYLLLQRLMTTEVYWNLWILALLWTHPQIGNESRYDLHISLYEFRHTIG